MRYVCCSDMARNLLGECQTHGTACPDVVVKHWVDEATYGIPVHDGGTSIIEIYFYPWCGRDLTTWNVVQRKKPTPPRHINELNPPQLCEVTKYVTWSRRHEPGFLDVLRLARRGVSSLTYTHLANSQLHPIGPFSVWFNVRAHHPEPIVECTVSVYAEKDSPEEQ